MSRVAVTPFEEVLGEGGPAVQGSMDDVERLLRDISSAYGAELARAAGSTLAAGGKRLRPLLVLLCGRAGDGGDADRAGGPEPLVRAAASVELVHMASLVHDDVVDGALLRRGHPTVFADAGRGAATATGDFLFSQAFALLEENGDPDQVKVLSEACLALARGELVQREDAFAGGIDPDRYLYRCELKTGSLFAAACRLGGRAGGVDARGVDALGRFGAAVGLAFQLLDDVLDVVGQAGETGKARGSDLLEGTTTLPLILAAREDAELARLDLRDLDTRAKAEAVCDRIAATRAPDEARRWAGRLVAEGKATLDGLLPAETERLLRLVADRVVDRYG